MGLHVDSMHARIRPDIGAFSPKPPPFLIYLQAGLHGHWPVGTVDIVDIGFSPTLPPFLI